MLLLLAVVIILFISILMRWQMRHKIAFANKFQCDIKTIPVLGHAYLFLSYANDKERWNVFKMLNTEAMKQGGAFCLWNMNKLYFFVADPVIANHVMKNCLEKDDALKSAMAPVSDSILLDNVPTWHSRRKLVASTFKYKNLMQYQKVFSKQSMILMSEFEKLSGRESVPIFKYFTSYAMDIVSETSLGNEANSQGNHNHIIRKAIAKSIDLIYRRGISPWLYFTPVYMLTDNYRQLKNNINSVFSFVQKVIVKLREELDKNKLNVIEDNTGEMKSFLDLMMKSSDYDDITLMKEVVILFVAATQVMATATSFISVLLARHPNVQEKVYKELQEVFGDSKRPVSYSDLSKLNYLEATIKEGLRLYPPGPFLLRKVHNDVVLPSGITLPKNTSVITSVYGAHRNPEYWGDDVDTFRPERFIERSPKQMFAFMAFNTGPRNCVGNQYALMAMKTTLATLIRHYHLLPNSNEEIEQPLDVKYDFALRTTDGFKVVLESRS